MKKKPVLFMVLLVLISAIPVLIGRGFRVAEIPNGTINGCANCHINPAGGGARNDFGTKIENDFLTVPGFSGHVEWGPDLAKLDSDNDGFTNGQELQDPFGLWKQGEPQPGNPAYVSLPGDVSDVPPAEAQLFSLDLHLTNMGPHVNQKMEFRLVRISDGEQVGYHMLDALPDEDEHIVFLNVFDEGQTYNIDFYADLNNNGQYDAPPTDHAWRITLEAVAGDTVVPFSHNTSFTDIEFPLSIIDGTDELAKSFELDQNYPNPFNPTTTIPFSLASSAYVKIAIYNTFGQKIIMLQDGRLGQGAYTVEWNGRDQHGQTVPTGTYFAVMSAENQSQFIKLSFVK